MSQQLNDTEIRELLMQMDSDFKVIESEDEESDNESGTSDVEVRPDNVFQWINDDNSATAVYDFDSSNPLLFMRIKVFDDVAVELTMAILQFFNSNPPEEHLFRCMKALTRFCQISSQDVPQLIQMIGPNPSTFKGKSERIDNCIAEISKKVR